MASNDSHRNGGISNRSRRSYLKALGAGSAGIGLAGCILGDDDGGEGVTLTISLGGGSYDVNREEAYMIPWRDGEDPWEENPHDYQLEPMDTGERETRLRAEGDDPPWDLMSQSGADALVHDDQLDVFHKHADILDNHENNADIFRNEVMGGQSASVWGIAWNTNELGDFEFNDWEDLLSAPIEGRAIVPSWGWIGNDFLYVINRALGGDEEDLDPGFEFWQEFVETQDPYPARSMDENLNLMESEDALACIISFDRSIEIEQNTDGAVETEFIIPEGGSMSTFFNFCPLKNRPEENLDAAIQLLEGINEPEPQANFAINQGSMPTNPDAFDHIPDDVIEETPSLQIDPETVREAGSAGVNWAATAERVEEDSERWRQITG